MDEEVILGFDKIIKLLSEQIKLTQPDFSKKFILNTDASSDAVCAVLSQDGKPILFISKTFSSSERITQRMKKHSIVWAFKNLRIYLYSSCEFEINTDYQQLTFAVSTQNPSARIKRWRSFIEEFSTKKFKNQV